MLAALAARAGGIVTKSELIESVWADIAVTDDSLVQCIADIRRALGDDAHKIVQTFPKKGYRLDSASFAPAGSGQPRAILTRLRRRGVLVVIAALVATILALYLMRPADSLREPDMPRIAVLPFDDLSSGDDKGYLSDAIAEGIITELARSKTYP